MSQFNFLGFFLKNSPTLGLKLRLNREKTPMISVFLLFFPHFDYPTLIVTQPDWQVLRFRLILFPKSRPEKYRDKYLIGYGISLRFLFIFSFGLTLSDIVEGSSVFVSELE